MSVPSDIEIAQAATLMPIQEIGAKPGEKILVISFGNGCDVILLEVTENITKLPERKSISGCLADKRAILNYEKYAKFRDLIQVEMGIRAIRSYSIGAEGTVNIMRMIIARELLGREFLPTQYTRTGG